MMLEAEWLLGTEYHLEMKALVIGFGVVPERKQRTYV